MLEQKSQRGPNDIYAARLRRETISPEDQKIINDFEEKEGREKREFSKNFKKGLEDLGFVVTEREKKMEGSENPKGQKRAYSNDGRFEATQIVEREDESRHTLTIVYTPHTRFETDIMFYVDNTNYQRNHDASISEIATQLKYAWNIALTGKSESGVDAALKEKIRKLQEIL